MSENGFIKIALKVGNLTECGSLKRLAMQISDLIVCIFPLVAEAAKEHVYEITEENDTTVELFRAIVVNFTISLV